MVDIEHLQLLGPTQLPVYRRGADLRPAARSLSPRVEYLLLLALFAGGRLLDRRDLVDRRLIGEFLWADSLILNEVFSPATP